MNLSTAAVFKAIGDTIQTIEVSGIRLTPHPSILSRGQPAEGRSHGTYRVVPLQPVMSQQGPCMKYKRQWQITISLALDLTGYQLTSMTRAFEIEDALVTALAPLSFVSQPPAGSYVEAENGRFLELVLILDTEYERPTSR